MSCQEPPADSTPQVPGTPAPLPAPRRSTAGLAGALLGTAAVVLLSVAVPGHTWLRPEGASDDVSGGAGLWSILIEARGRTLDMPLADFLPVTMPGHPESEVRTALFAYGSMAFFVLNWLGIASLALVAAVLGAGGSAGPPGKTDPPPGIEAASVGRSSPAGSSSAGSPTDEPRREFMRAIGLTMLSLLGARQLAGCRSSPSAGRDVPGMPTGTGWDRVRSCWIGLLEWQESSTEYADGWDDARLERDRRGSEHRAALDPLIAAGEVRPPVAELLQVGFEETADHVLQENGHDNVGSTCYRYGKLFGRVRDGRERLLERLVLLDKMVRDGQVDPETVALSRRTIEDEIAVLDAAARVFTLESRERRQAEDDLVNRIEARGLQPSPDEREAARLLVDALLGRRR